MLDMPDFINTYTVYDNHTNKVVVEGTWPEVEDYAECEGRYTIVSNANGMIVN
jgi:hypothetical protein